MSKNVNRVKKAGRPKGSKTAFSGITDFCNEHGYTPQHVHMVLTGARQSARVRGLWRLYKNHRAAR